jgi:hypothetical protein
MHGGLKGIYSLLYRCFLPGGRSASIGNKYTINLLRHFGRAAAECGHEKFCFKFSPQKVAEILLIMDKPKPEWDLLLEDVSGSFIIVMDGFLLTLNPVYLIGANPDLRVSQRPRFESGQFDLQALV